MAPNPPSANSPTGDPGRSGPPRGERKASPPVLNPTSSSSPSASAHPQKIGKYEIEKKLGSGGMGAVYLALDTQLRRQVALKVLPREKAENPTLVRRFQAEAKAAANLRHENIVTVYEAGFDDGYLYMALEFVDGVDTAELVARRGVVPVKRSLEIVKQILKALEHACERSIVHRDIKPANLLIRRDGVVKLTDLGLARSREDPAESGITRAGTTVGTIDYMSPEQARDSKSADVRSDLYSLGCTWYFLLTGEPPFPEGSLTNKLRAHAETRLPDPRAKNPQVTEAVVAVIQRMTEKDPRQRYQTPTELLAELDVVQSGRVQISELGLSRLMQAEGATPESRSGSKGSRPAPLGLPPAPGTSPDAASRAKLKEAIAQGVSDQPQRDYRALFYGIVGAVALSLLGGVGWLVRQYSQGFDAPQVPRVINDPFANREVRDIVHSAGPPPEVVPVSEGHTPPPPRRGTLDEPVNKSRPRTAPEGSPSFSPPRVEDKRNSLPAWVAAPPSLGPAPTLLVREHPRRAGEFATLNDALESVPANGAVIELEGKGPFLLRPTEVLNREWLILRGHDSNIESPVVLVLAGTGGDPGASVLHLQGTRLEMRGLHFAINLNTFPAPPSSLFSVTGGNFSATDCQFTVQNGYQTSGPLTAIRVAGGAETSPGAPVEPAQVLLSDCLFRGSRLNLLTTELPHADIVLKNVWAWSGLGTSLQVGLPGESLPPRARLAVHLHQCTLISQTCGLDFIRTAGDAAPSRIDVSLKDSLLAVPFGSDRATLCRLSGWNSTQSKKACGQTLTWQSQQTIYLGWNRLLETPSTGGALASSARDWLQVFDHQLKGRPLPGDAAQFQVAHWPDRLPETIIDLDPAQLSLLKLGDPPVPASDGKWPGARPQPGPPTKVTGLLAAAAQIIPRSPVPELFPTVGGEQVLHVDLNREDLGRVLSSRPLKTGTTVIASGANRHLCTPFVIDGTWVRIRFEQTDGPPLMLVPRPPEVMPVGYDDAFISVRGGALELISAPFVAPEEGKPVAKWLLHGVNSDLVLRHCRLEGPMSSTGRNLGVIQWQRGGFGALARPVSGPFAYESYLVLQDSYVSGAGALLQADMPKRAIFMRNCILAGRDTALELHYPARETQVDSLIDLEQSTLSAGDTVLRVEGPDLSEIPSAPLQIFADRCIFGPPLKVGDKAPPAGLLAVNDLFLKRNGVRWREAYCGYAPDLQRYLQPLPGGKILPQDFAETWQKQWGPLFVRAPLTGEGGVRLVEPLPDRRKLEPAHFKLSSQCAAISWAPFEQPIGASIPAMNLPEARPGKWSPGGSASPGTGSASTPKSNGSKSNSPAKGKGTKPPPRKIEVGF